jgi:membrane associated rhomboid family serine protease
MNRLDFRYYPNNLSPEALEVEKRIFKLSLIFPIIFLIIIWLIKISESFLGISFYQWGMYPRDINGLKGILFSPLIHGSFKHLIANSSSFIVLATALFFFYRKMAMPIFLLNYFLSGIFLWIGGREVWHIGASGIIYGLAAFLFFSGLFRNDLRLLTISLIIVFLYGSFVWGLFPIEPGVSWDGHLMGAVSGIILSARFQKHGPPRIPYEWENEPEDEEDIEDISNEDDETERKP